MCRGCGLSLVTSCGTFRTFRSLSLSFFGCEWALQSWAWGHLRENPTWLREECLVADNTYLSLLPRRTALPQHTRLSVLGTQNPQVFLRVSRGRLGLGIGLKTGVGGREGRDTVLTEFLSHTRDPALSVQGSMALQCEGRPSRDVG